MRHANWIACSIAALAVITLSGAQEAAGALTAEGELLSIDRTAGSMVLDVDGAPWDFATTAATELAIAPEPKSLDDLRPGDRLRITYEQTAEGARTATHIALAEPDFVPAPETPLTAKGAVTRVDAAARTVTIATVSGDVDLEFGPGEPIPADLRTGESVAATWTPENGVNRIASLERMEPVLSSDSGSVIAGSQHLIPLAVIGSILLVTALLAVRSTRRTRTEIHI